MTHLADIEYLTIRLTTAEYEAIYEAAKDVHLGTPEYARLMVLAASGMGGVIEHLQRAVQASIVAAEAAGQIEEVGP